MPPADAEREARRQFGNVMSIRERARDQWGSVAVAALVQDVKFGARMLARSPGLSVVVVLTIAFGSFLNGAVFLQLNDTFLGATDLPNAETLVWLDDGGPRTGGTTYPDYVDYRERVPAMDLAVFAGGGNASDGGGSGRRSTSQCRPRYRELFPCAAGASGARTHVRSVGRPPATGNAGCGAERRVLAARVRSRQRCSRTIQVNFKPFTVVGVMPPGFSGGRRPGSLAYTPDVWVPIWCHPWLEPGSNLLQGRTMWWGLQAIGRLREGVGIPQARAEVKAVAAALNTEYPGQSKPRAPRVWRVTDFDTGLLRGQEAAMLGIAAAATMLVMLIACGNVAGLLLARAAARRQEIAIRLSLGASRARILRQFLTEGLTLSAAGTLVGFILAAWVSVAASKSGAGPAAIDGRIVIYAAVLALLATLSAGLMPGNSGVEDRAAPGLDPDGDLTGWTAADSAGRSRGRHLTRPAADGCAAVARCRARERGRPECPSTTCSQSRWTPIGMAMRARTSK